MKKLYTIFRTMTVAACVGASAIGAMAQTYFYQNDMRFKVLSEEKKTCALASNTNTRYPGDIVVPAKVKNDTVEYTVTAIGGYAFYACPDTKTVSLPSTIEEIQD